MKEFHLLFGLPSFRTFLKAGTGESVLQESLLKWSSDLLVKIAIEAEQHFLSRCPPPPRFAEALDQVKAAYLKGLGVTSKFSSAERAILFRGLAVEKKDVPDLRRKIEGLAYDSTALSLLAKLYGAKIGDFNGVLLISPKESQGAVIRKLVAGWCGNSSPCPLWNSTVLYRVVLVRKVGLAAFVPELGVLYLSDEIVDNPRLLENLVFVHELAHVAARAARVVDENDWELAFAELSGWKRNKGGSLELEVNSLAPERRDILSQMANQSPFSFLPDPVLVSKATGEGFVFARSFRESKKRGDISEDIADHLAAYVIVPERFCFAGKPIASKKYEWIAHSVFGKTTKLECR